MEKMAMKNIQAAAARIRMRIVKMISASGSAHVGTALSATDILAALYFRVLKVDPKKPEWKERDIFIMSKGHGCSALYATLAERGFSDPKILEGFSQDDGTLWGHVTSKTMPGIEASTGSLGHGLPIGLGRAIARKGSRVFVLLSDGECDEGSVWEAILFAGHRKQDNLVAIVDYNKIQSFGSVKEVLDLEPFADKWKAARWAVREVDGHDIGALVKALSSAPFEKGKPSVVIAHTVKGKGVSYMENSLDWHYKTPKGKELEKAMNELQKCEDDCED